jgi:hypothetical protein
MFKIEGCFGDQEVACPILDTISFIFRKLFWRPGGRLPDPGHIIRHISEVVLATKRSLPGIKGQYRQAPKHPANHVEIGIRKIR